MVQAAGADVRHPGIHQAITERVASWPGVVASPHRFGGTEFHLGKVEIGHLHGERLADLPFPRRLRDELVAAGRAVPHHVLPQSGWVSRWINGPEDIDDVVALFRLNYERYAKRGF
ncbi:MAG TPA: luciferase family protein [Actinomycetota bacterium]|nr:luciferase family protein [Actinomycetota bacterium]